MSIIHSLWEHQTMMRDEVHARHHIHPTNNILGVSATGSGKSVIAAIIAKEAKRTLVVTHRIELISQLKAEFDRYGVENYLILTPTQALKVDHRLFDFLIIDEAHRSCARTYRELVFLFRNKKILGLTATPVRTDGQPLDAIYDYVIESPQIPYLQQMGILSRTIELSIPLKTNLKDIPISKVTYDFEKDELSHKMRDVSLYGEVVREFKKNSLDRKNITYCVNIRHAMEMTEYYKKHGLNAVCVSSFTNIKERREIYNDFSSGKIQILVNCMIYTEGINVPDVSSITSLRPTHSIILHYQMSGRGIRYFPGKKDCLLLDHSGNIQRHGSISDFRDWEYKKNGRKLKPIIEYSNSPSNSTIRKRNVRYRIYDGMDLDYYVNPSRKITPSMARCIIIELKNNIQNSIEDICNRYGYTIDSFIAFINQNKYYKEYFENSR